MQRVARRSMRSQQQPHPPPPQRPPLLQRLQPRRPLPATAASASAPMLARKPRSGAASRPLKAVEAPQVPSACGAPTAGHAHACLKHARRRGPSTVCRVAMEDETAQFDSDALAEEGEEQSEALQQLSLARHVITEEEFLPCARQLRDVFDQRFGEPRSNSPARFMWDYWHVPDQYTLIRTQAKVYFPEALYDQLEDALIEYGERQLGCRAISPIWLSYYVDGCQQELHCDNPHGPFAFVLSLTEWDVRQFRGGETMILRPGVLDYWGSLYSAGYGLEMDSLMELVEPVFNRLTVFDPRFPHGVRQVSGTKDPREARLVLHGWFTQPTPFFSGGLTAEEAQPVLDAAMQEVMDVLAELPVATGVLAVRLRVRGSDGGVDSLKFLADTLVPLPAGPDLPADQIRAGFQRVVVDALSKCVFPAGGDDSEITLPVVFE
uniref:Prolyl 4-hydroxylase alpha subunit Fe(2+) 2OG dioxygenase domain-containing protein n=1 Tax=Chlamydomonas euryale TaxID=1486919 RepID=A0A7R9V1D2_9CHLO|mmetsp:Transcript_14213/g.41369  ORF Transcript_14213/g.41369 Transcript_14213/m.41369 type:complete len:435 (+) Transcript_14213:110-1414(+)